MKTKTISKNSKTTQLFLFGAVVFVFAGMYACSSPFNGSGRNSSVQVSIRIPAVDRIINQNAGGRFIHPDTKYLVVSLSGEGMETVSEDATVAVWADRYTIKVLDVPPGDNRTITVSLYDAPGEGKILLAEGTTTMKVLADAVNSVSVTAVPKNAVALTLEVAATLPAGSGGKTFVYYAEVPVDRTFSVALSEASIVPTLYNAGGTNIEGTSTGSGVVVCKAAAAGVYYAVVTIPAAFTDSSTITISLVSNAREITAFGFSAPVSVGVITGTNIAVTLPFGTSDVSALIPTITHSGVGLSPASGVARDFSAPVDYTVTAADGSTQVYTVTVTVSTITPPEYSVTISPVFSNAANKTLVFTPSVVSMAAGTTLSISTGNAQLASLSGWKWYVDGTQTAGATTSAFSFDGNLYTAGTTHIISASVSESGILYSGSLSVSILAAAATTYSVTYSSQFADGGDVPIDAGQYASGSSVTVLGNSAAIPLRRANSTFVGWTDNAAGTGTVYGPGKTVSYTISSDIVFYPKWYVDVVSPTVGVLKYVPAGLFQRDANPANISRVSASFHMSAYEITRAQFYKVMGGDFSDPAYSPDDSHPVQNLNWYHAITFCNKLSLAEGLTPVYSVAGVDFSNQNYETVPQVDDVDWNAAVATWTNNGYRLPTEMEWMWAAMGASSGSGYAAPVYLTGYAKPFAGSTGSNSIDNYAVYGSLLTNPAGSKLPNELGLYDMSGNVWEWCWDKYDAYPSGVLTSDAADGSGRGAAAGNPVLRGGGFNSDVSQLPPATRASNLSYFQDPHFGFRVVRN